MAAKTDNEGEWKRKGDLAKTLGISRPTLDKYLYQDDAPKSNKSGEWNVEEVAGFIGRKQIETRTHGKAHWEAEKVKLQCQKIEHELAVERGQYINISEISKVIVPLMAELGQLLRQKFELELPSRYQGKDRIECGQINAEAVDYVINRFRSGTRDLVEAS